MEVSDEAIAHAIERFTTMRRQGTLANVLAFGRVLKQLGLKVTLSQVIDASRSLGHVEIERKGDFRAVLCSNLVSHKDEIPVFDRVFDCFWVSGPEELDPDAAPGPPSPSPDGSAETEGSGESGNEV